MMETNLLTEPQAQDMVSQYMAREGATTPTQQILDSGAIPRLKGYTVRPGKVSDSIFGGKGSYHDKAQDRDVEFENPPLETPEGVPLRYMVRTARISTHDIVRGNIPFKDQILALNHHHMLDLVKDTIGASQYDVPGMTWTSVVIAAENLIQIPFENVLRAYMAKSTTSTSLYQAFMRGERTFAGHALPDWLFANGLLPYIMDTPSTKSDVHDETVSPEVLFERGHCTPVQYAEIRNSSLVAFGMVAQFLRQQGVLLADTKTEHGINHLGRIVSQDELFTLDSSRFWDAFDYGKQLKKLVQGEITELNPKSFSKEFARGFSEGEKGYTDEQRAQIAVRYIMGIQLLLGKRFEPDMRPRDERVTKGLEAVVKLAAQQ